MTKYLFKIWLMGMFATAITMVSCSDEPNIDEPQPNEESVDEHYIRFRINVKGDGLPDNASRAGETELVTPGTPHEDVINTVDILVYDAETDKMVGMLHFEKGDLDGLTSPEGVIVPIITRKGQKLNIYAGVNFSPDIRHRFYIGMQGHASAMTSSSNSYRDIINDFVPGSNGLQETLEANPNGCIPMTGQFVVAATGATEITVGPENSTESTARLITADVSRIVAKMQVLTKTEEHTLSTGEKVRYAVAKDMTQSTEGGTGPYTNWMGWIRLENVRFMPNSANRSSYIFPQKNDAGKLYGWKDLNMDINSYVIGGHGDEVNFNAAAWSRDYAFYTGEALHSENISPASGFGQAEAFDQTKYDNTLNGSSDPNRYVRGLYCTENYFNMPTLNVEALRIYDDALPMVTHVSIAAKLTPRYLVLTHDFVVTMDKFVDEYELRGADLLAEYGLTYEDFDDSDVARWKEMKQRYDKELVAGQPRGEFTGTDNLYRNGKYRIVKTDNEADALNLLNWSLQINRLWSSSDNEFNMGKYPAGTFYSYDRKYEQQAVAPISAEWNQGFLYLSAGAVAAAEAENSDLKTYSIPHVGGWGYYYTYLDQLKTSQNRVPYTSSQVTRNTYYIISIGNFGVPGGSITHPEYIRVNTNAVGWDYTGRGDINLH